MGTSHSQVSCGRALPVIVLLTIATAAAFGPVWTAGGQASSPTVSIDFPHESDILAGQVDIRGKATDATAVEVKFDAEDTWRAAEGAVNWTFDWDTTVLSNDFHTIYARASNGTATSDTVSVRVYVDNTPPEFISMDVTATPLDVGPREDVTVSGFLEYDNGVSLRGTVVDVKVGGAGIHETAVTDDNGYFQKVIVGPEDADTYPLTVSASDGTLSETREFQLKVTTPYQPDLTIKKLEVSPPDVRIGDVVEIYASIENLGEDDATCKVRFYVDDGLIDSVAISIDKTKTVKTSWTASHGEHEIKAEAADVDPVDKDLANNAMTMKVVPRAEPDVTIIEVAFSNPSPRQGQRISVLVRLDNSGYAGATGTLKVYDGTPLQGAIIATQTFTIEVNGTLDLFAAWKPLKGDHEVYADIEVQGQERVEGHTMSRTISVLPLKKEKEDTPGPGAVLVLAAVVVAATVVAVGKGRA